ncbi:hypothetical protein EH223_06695 [candidate division KSB1 bacterium]|nr:hypothetical protein [candidate division KSB1 bacterium]RQW04840.1 MAG: hypothetical protein EH223_06695 [candidate division KSB1 bacterium]
MKKCFYVFILLLYNLGVTEELRTALVRIDISGMSDQDIRQLVAMNLDITSIQRAEGRMDAILSAEQQRLLREQGIALETAIADVSAYARQLRNENYFKHFHSNEQILQEMKQVAADHPSIALLFDIGDSYLKTIGRGGHDIWALKISDNVWMHDPFEADVLYMANMHAREIITPEIILFFMHYLIDNYKKDPYVTHLVNNRELWLIPTFNPDGHEYVFTGDASHRDDTWSNDPLWWRKNQRDNNENGEFDSYYDGVDLNRNFGFAWGMDNEGSSPDPTSQTYRGPEAFSEPESQAIRDLVRQRDFVISLSYHSYSNLWLYPWGFTFDPLPEPDASIFRALADSCVFYNNYKPQAGADLYLVNGDTDDWLYGQEGIWAFTPEVGDRVRDHYFFPDTNRILPLVLENLGPNLFMAYAAGEEPIIEHVTIEDTIDQMASLEVLATIQYPIVLNDSVGLDTSRFRLLYRQASDADFSSLSLNFDDSTQFFRANIPGVGMSGTVYFYVEAFDSLGRRGTSPRAAPMAVDSFFVKWPTMADSKNLAAVQTFALDQNYPNPFNASTTLTFMMPKESYVSLDIYDVRGRLISNISQGFFPAGKHTLIWDGRDVAGTAVPSGIFYARLQAPLLQKSIKMVLLR